MRQKLDTVAVIIAWFPAAHVFLQLLHISNCYIDNGMLGLRDKFVLARTMEKEISSIRLAVLVLRGVFVTS